MKVLVRLTIIIAMTVGLNALPAGAKTSPTKSCVAALDAAEEVVQLNTEYLNDVRDYFNTVAASAQRNSSGSIAAVTAFLREQTTAVQALTGQTRDITPRVQSAVSTYNTAATKCRAGK